MLHIYSHPEAVALGWETKGNKLTVSAGVVNGMQLPGEPHLTQVPSAFDGLIDVKTDIRSAKIRHNSGNTPKSVRRDDELQGVCH